MKIQIMKREINKIKSKQQRGMDEPFFKFIKRNKYRKKEENLGETKRKEDKKRKKEKGEQEDLEEEEIW